MIYLACCTINQMERFRYLVWTLTLDPQFETWTATLIQVLQMYTRCQAREELKLRSTEVHCTHTPIF